jgi:hypothetical protein
MNKTLLLAISLVASSALAAISTDVEIQRRTADISTALTKISVSDGRTIEAINAGGSCPLIPVSCPVNVSRSFTRDCIDTLFGSSAELFTFHGTAGELVRMTVESFIFPVDWFIYSPSGSFLGSGDYVSNNSNGSIEDGYMYLPATGTYTFQAETLYGTGAWADPFHNPLIGPYTLKITGCDSALPPPSGGSCVRGGGNVCLLSNRFRVTVAWNDQHTAGHTGTGSDVTDTDQTGFFWFFNSASKELVVKIVDGRGFNGKFWFFYGALSDVEYTITVTDTQTGSVRTYHNAPGNICGGADTSAF